MAEGVLGVPCLRGHCLSPSFSFSLRYTTNSPNSISFFTTPALAYLRQRITHSNSNPHLYTAVVSSDSKPTSLDLDNSSGGSDATGGGNGGGGGGGGGSGDSNGGENNKGEEGSDGEQKRKMALSMSQKFTLGYAALVGAGGVMGYLKSGSQKSLFAGGLSAALLYYVYTELPVRPVFASSLGLGISAALLGVMGSRFKKSGKVFPAGVVSLVSLVMTGGYLHGIMRSMH